MTCIKVTFSLLKNFVKNVQERETPVLRNWFRLAVSFVWVLAEVRGDYRC